MLEHGGWLLADPQPRQMDRKPFGTAAECTLGLSTALLYSRFSKPAPMFLDDSFRKWARIREFVPPFGIKGQGMLGTLPHFTLTSHPPSYLPSVRTGLYPQKCPCWESTPLDNALPSLPLSCPSFFLTSLVECLLRNHHFARG